MFQIGLGIHLIVSILIFLVLWATLANARDEMKQILGSQQPSDRRVLKLLIAVHAFIYGVTVCAVGLIAATALGLLSETAIGIHALIIIAIGWLILVQSKAKWKMVTLALSAGIYGLTFLR